MEEEKEIVSENPDENNASGKADDTIIYNGTTKKRFAVISVISVLSVLLVSVSVLAVFMYLSLVRKDNLYNAIDKIISSTAVPTDKKEISPTDLLKEIGRVFENNYVGETDNEALKKSLLISFFTNNGDKYSDYYTPEQYEELIGTMSGTTFGIGFMAVYHEKGLYVDRVFKDAPADTAGLKAGDFVIEVNGVDIVGMSVSDATDMIKGESGTDVTLTVIRGEKKLTITATRGEYEFDTVVLSYREKDGKKIAVIRIEEFYEKTGDEFKKAMDDAIAADSDGFIFDLRGNPGGYMDSALAMLDYLLPEGPIIHLVFNNELNNKTFTSDEAYVTDLPMVVLVNESSASAAEIFTSALKDYEKATIVGMKTFGKGCGQQFYSLSNGDKIKLTSFLYNPPFSENFNGIGITPDIETDLSEEAKQKSLYILTEEEDTQMSKALEVVTSGISAK